MHKPGLQQSYFATDFDFSGSGVCVEGMLSWYTSSIQSDGTVYSITGIPLACIDGQFLTALCNDNTSDPSSADVLCTGLGYYG